ncbi:hypothetical protein DXT88_22160 [Herbaspirillum lusitanum]|uniref:hypothetical protein n=1 Tax=Herbaspirillum lusitanum TaxID=213312 RepID=UPI0022386B38|nr:hypothetical protein [Herbaspirillum lusitanum]MCW5300880.1 hypothetical protein [Herbaspirillum lusitanum]
MVKTKQESPLERLVNAAVIAGSVIYCGGMFELSEKIAFEDISEALKPFGGMPTTDAMKAADTRWKKVEPHAKSAKKSSAKKER